MIYNCGLKAGVVARTNIYNYSLFRVISCYVLIVRGIISWTRLVSILLYGTYRGSTKGVLREHERAQESRGGAKARNRPWRESNAAVPYI